MIEFLHSFWPFILFGVAAAAAAVRLYLGHERRIRDLEENRSLGVVSDAQNFADHATIKTTLGVLEVKVDKSSEAVNSLVLYLRLKDDGDGKR